MTRREHIRFLRTLSLKLPTEEAKELRALANELENELNAHNETARRSYHNKRRDSDATGLP